jgi:hypothetical protein
MQEQVTIIEKKPNMLAFKSAISYAVYFLALIFIFKWLGIDQNDPNISISDKIISALASYVPFILAVVYVQTTWKKELGGYISFGKAFSTGFKVAAYAGLFIALFLILYYLVLDRDALNTIMNTAIETAGDDENKVKGVEMMRPYMIYFIGFGAAITYTVFGLIVSLIAAAILKNERPLYAEEAPKTL